MRFFGEDQMAAIIPRFDFSDISVLVAEHNAYMRQTMRSILRTFNVKYRHDLVVSTARWLIKQQLKANPALRAKLYTIRQNQEQADRLAKMAEQASWPALPSV